MANILIIDDDVELCDLLKEFLGLEGFIANAKHDGLKGLVEARKGDYDLIILDIGMPYLDGFQVLGKLREESDIPVLMLTASGESADKVKGLNNGADDYLPKPFDYEELAARVRAILRRFQPVDKAQTVLSVDEITLYLDELSAEVNGSTLHLTELEFSILKILLENAGRVVNKTTLSHKVLKRTLQDYDRSIDVHISNLRKKLSACLKGESRIETRRGLGYVYSH